MHLTLFSSLPIVLGAVQQQRGGVCLHYMSEPQWYNV